jgi:hypothetical protein
MIYWAGKQRFFFENRVHNNGLKTALHPEEIRMLIRLSRKNKSDAKKNYLREFVLTTIFSPWQSSDPNQ